MKLQTVLLTVLLFLLPLSLPSCDGGSDPSTDTDAKKEHGQASEQGQASQQGKDPEQGQEPEQGKDTGQVQEPDQSKEPGQAQESVLSPPSWIQGYWTDDLVFAARFTPTNVILYTFIGGTSTSVEQDIGAMSKIGGIQLSDQTSSTTYTVTVTQLAVGTSVSVAYRFTKQSSTELIYHVPCYDNIPDMGDFVLKKQ
jgi:hypothetical protein